ncbi:hypothetical protein L345_06766, partial [Ophiophagus hannah]
MGRLVAIATNLYCKEMFSLFRKSQDTKKVVVTDKEVDGFVFLENESGNYSNHVPLGVRFFAFFIRLPVACPIPCPGCLAEEAELCGIFFAEHRGAI